MKHHRWISSMVLLALCFTTVMGSSRLVKSGDVTWTIDEASLKIAAASSNIASITVAEGLSEAATFKSSTEDADSWLLGNGVSVFVREAESGGLALTISSEKNQRVEWPIIPLQRGNDSLIWPQGEGVCIPISDSFWREEILAEEWEMVESMSIPAWGIKRGDVTVSWSISSPFRNTITFGETGAEDVLKFMHSFSAKSQERAITFVIHVEKDASVLSPALHFRERQQKLGQFRSLKQKASERPEVEKLRGAIHAYLWGDSVVTRYDIVQEEWKPLCAKLLSDSDVDGSASHALKELFSKEQWSAVLSGVKEEFVNDYLKEQIAEGLSAAVESSDFAQSPVWKTIDLSTGEGDDKTEGEVIRRNCERLSAAFPGTFLPVQEWGNGASTKMMEQIAAAGIERAKLCIPDEHALAIRPWVVEDAKKRGWLIGTYDSYHSVHDPATMGSDATWSTAQMTADLFASGGVKKENGEYYVGFKGIGRKLNSVYGRGYVESRVTKFMERAPYNYYFLDCDATGEIYDDYDQAHPMALEEDAAARCDRLEWIGKNFNSVVGSEGGNAYAAESIDVAEGIFAPYFGWDDADMKNKESKYYRGRYYPADAPEVNFKPVPLKERFVKKYHDARFQIPLYAAAYHDSVVATSHWSNAQFKYPEVEKQLSLTEILYLAPPMYHFNIAEFKKRRDSISKLYSVWSPLHKAFGFEPLTEFKWITADRLVQQATYGGGCVITVNFGDEEFRGDSFTIPAMSAHVSAPSIWAEPAVYTP